MASSENLKTPLARVAFTQGLFKPQKDQRGNERWTCSLLYPKSTDLSEMKNLAVETAVEEWGEKARQMIADGLIHSPFLDGDGPQGKSKKTGEAHKGFPGTTFIRVMSGLEYRPTMVDQKLQPVVKPEQLKSGWWVYPVVNCFTWENTEKGKGLTFGLQMLQVVKEDEVLGGSGGGDPKTFFDKIVDQGAAPDSTQDGKGAAGLFG